MPETITPLDRILVRTGGLSGAVVAVAPMPVFVVTSSLAGVVNAAIAATTVSLLALLWTRWRKLPPRPAVWGLLGVASSAALASATGDAKDFFLPEIWVSLVTATVLSLSVVAGHPVVGHGWAWLTGQDGSWRQNRRVRRAFGLATFALAAAAAARLLVKFHLYGNDELGWLAFARIAMGWPLVTATGVFVYMAIRFARQQLVAGGPQAGFQSP